MLPTALIAAAVLAAPVPKLAPAGLAPYLLQLDSADGQVTVGVFRTEKVETDVQEVRAGPNNQQVVVTVKKAVEVQVFKKVPLAELKELKITTAGGKDVKSEDAAKKIADGGLVLASADGKPVDPKYLRLFKDDVLVLVSPELVPKSVTGADGLIDILQSPPVERNVPPPFVFPGSEPPKKEK